MMLRMLDLFSGLGGASEAFHQHEDWEVLRIDNLELLETIENTVILNLNDCEQVLGLFSRIRSDFDLIWASPPCTHFSTANPNRNPDLGIPLVERTIDIIKSLNPDVWIIENVLGSINPLQPLLGPPRLILGPYVFWGNFPLFWVNPDQLKKDTSKYGPSDPLRTQKRALIPFKISQALLRALESQTRFNFFSSSLEPSAWQYVRDSSIE